MTVDDFLGSLAGFSLPKVFNPYSDRCAAHDVEDAPSVRLGNVRLAVEAALAVGVDSLWVARDLGHRGGRRTGLVLTDEAHLQAHERLYGDVRFAKATNGAVVAERTARVVWQSVRAVGRPVFLWNVFPLHPHEAGQPLSNRRHTSSERRACLHLLLWRACRKLPVFTAC